MAIKISDFRALFEEFNKVPAPKVELFLQLAGKRVAQSVWGTMWETGVYYLAAHMLASSGGAGGVGGAAGGALTQVSVGDLSRTYTPIADSDTGDSTFKTTAYGRMFLELRRENVVGATVTGAPPPGIGVC